MERSYGIIDTSINNVVPNLQVLRDKGKEQ
jgi:hypothetical protein